MAVVFPPSPTIGQIVTDPTTGAAWIYNGVAWVPQAAGAGGFLALSGGTLTGPLTLGPGGITNDPAMDNVGRNLIHNGMFRVQQRGAGPFTAVAAYTLDRWITNGAAPDTLSISSYTMTDADRSTIGDEAAVYGLQNVFTGGASPGFQAIGQHMEGVRRLSGKTVIISFWAKASVGTPKLAVTIHQNFGTGGSPSATTQVNLGPTAALSTVWTRYTFTGTYPSTAGKTFGTTTNTDNAQLNIWYSDGAAYSASGIGAQSGTVQIWGVQVEVAQAGQTQPTPLEKIDLQAELANCQRFYQAIYFQTVGSASGAGTITSSALMFSPMRAAPTAAMTGISYGGNTTSTAFGASYPNMVAMQLTTSAAAAAWAFFTANLSADL